MQPNWSLFFGFISAFSPSNQKPNLTHSFSFLPYLFPIFHYFRLFPVIVSYSHLAWRKQFSPNPFFFLLTDLQFFPFSPIFQRSFACFPAPTILYSIAVIATSLSSRPISVASFKPPSHNCDYPHWLPLRQLNTSLVQSRLSMHATPVTLSTFELLQWPV